VQADSQVDLALFTGKALDERNQSDGGYGEAALAEV
jgi:hypothetical protein